jgi:hypothetical protein
MPEIILHEMCTDDSASSEFISEKLTALYCQASPEDKAVIDNIFIALTGWGFATLLTKEHEDVL